MDWKDLLDEMSDASSLSECSYDWSDVGISKTMPTSSTELDDEGSLSLSRKDTEALSRIFPTPADGSESLKSRSTTNSLTHWRDRHGTKHRDRSGQEDVMEAWNQVLGSSSKEKEHEKERIDARCRREDRGHRQPMDDLWNSEEEDIAMHRTLSSPRSPGSRGTWRSYDRIGQPGCARVVRIHRERKRKRKPGWRLHAINLFLTYPQNNANINVVMAKIINKLDPAWVVVAQEHHKDGSLHIHCVVHLKRQGNWTNSNCFDCFTGKHGKYEVCRKLEFALIYITKENKYVCTGIDVDNWLKLHKAKKSTLGDTVVTLIREGKSFEEITYAHPGYAMIHRRQINDMINDVMQWNYNAERGDWVCPDFSLARDPEQGDIIAWLIVNIRHKRKFKQAQLWIWGERNLGKSSFLNWLDQTLKIYWIPKENFDNLWIDNTYDLAVMDAFVGQRSIAWMEEFSQGGTQPLRTKGGQTVRRHNIPLIVCSNSSIQGAYHNTSFDRTQVLAIRFNVINVQNFIDFYLDM